MGPRMDGALGSPGNPDTPLLPTSLAFLLPSQALPFTEALPFTWGSVACPLIPSPRLCPTWLDESGAGTERTEGSGTRLFWAGLLASAISTYLENVTLPFWAPWSLSVKTCGQDSRQCR